MTTFTLATLLFPGSASTVRVQETRVRARPAR